MVFKLSESGAISVLAGNGLESGHADGVSSEARFNSNFSQMTTDALGNLYTVDGGTIRKITPDGVVSTIAGNPQVAGVVNGKASDALFHSLRGITIDAAGNLYVTDTSRIVGTVDYRHHSSIRKITPSGEVSTLAGPTTIGFGSTGYADGVGGAARFYNPGAIVADKAGNLYVADGSCMIRKVTQDGVVTTFAGKDCSSGGHIPSVDGVGSAARFGVITALAIDQKGNLYALDRNWQTFTVRKVSGEGVVTTIAGGEFGNVDANGLHARFGRPTGSYGVGDGSLTLDNAGNLYVSDTENKSIRRVTPQGNVTTIAANVASIAYGQSYGPYGIAFVAPKTLAIGLLGRLVKLSAQ